MGILDSYERFMAKFNIDKDDLYQFGISETILPPTDLVAQNWEDSKKGYSIMVLSKFVDMAVMLRGLNYI